MFRICNLTINGNSRQACKVKVRANGPDRGDLVTTCGASSELSYSALTAAIVNSGQVVIYLI
jgi:hypothetical protein